MLEKTYPVAEIFVSPQGEGHWTGTLMAFVRLAGCNVGKPYTTAAKETLGLQMYQEKCTLWDGNSFPCDTNYRKARTMSVNEIMDEVGDIPRMLLTGGEPLMHDVEPLIRMAWVREKYVHLETSGTKPLPSSFNRMSYKDPSCYRLWVAVSPKKDCLPEMLQTANEIRVLVGEGFDEPAFISRFGKYIENGGLNEPKVFISAINDEHRLNMENNQKCLQLQLKYPKLRLSLQTHKILGVR